MVNYLKKITENKDHFTIGVVFVLMIVLILLPKGSIPGIPSQEQSVDEEISSLSESEIQAESPPVLLRIPKINLETTFGPALGLKENREVEVPEGYDEVGWYQYSPKPGQLGPAVVLGHVDSYEGPAVFFSIGQLEPGDEIIIKNEAGEDLVFEVTASERYEQNAFPTELVYGDIDHAGLRLVTCSGWYDKELDRYTHNRVVFARLKGG